MDLANTYCVIGTMQAGVGETVKPGEFQFAQICDIFVGVF
jgi:hypothetical protein